LSAGWLPNSGKFNFVGFRGDEQSGDIAVVESGEAWSCCMIAEICDMTASGC
jgi:hypothetical protein